MSSIMCGVPLTRRVGGHADDGRLAIGAQLQALLQLCGLAALWDEGNAHRRRAVLAQEDERP